VAPARAAPRRRGGRSPFWAAVRSHVWLAVIVLVVAGAAGAGYWVLRVHQRIGDAALERSIAAREHAPTVRCAEQQSNGAVWACGLRFAAETECLVANVNPLGEWGTNPGWSTNPDSSDEAGGSACDRDRVLVALLPETISPTAVQADVVRKFGIAGVTCRKQLDHRVRWLCLGPPETGNKCILVRVVAWTPWTSVTTDACQSYPRLVKAAKRAAA
jgi:hypothetical protein